MIRAVRDPIQNVTNWSATPDSVTPSLPDLAGEVQNHKVVFNALNDNTISFDYSCTINTALTAIWIEKLVVYDTEPARLTFDFDSTVYSMDLSVSPDSDAVQISNESVEAVRTPTGDLSSGATSALLFTADNLKTLSFDLLIGHGSASFTLNELVISDAEYGVFREDDAIVLIPPPEDAGPPTLAAKQACSPRWKMKRLRRASFCISKEPAAHGYLPATTMRPT